ncbi:hypothetical protein LJ739_06790 [Aestuariibacter halophilus]|uniref:Terminase small subunit n=1 Tax=Fluctibacter halophilus TaxID=226011 RepID=A0ABS8G619_9ALTE|nr:hypothetical protein [Aestuariibacter halophilus]MCC2615943.1 hypothetical protein [Aestuariibacter halophilus]
MAAPKTTKKKVGRPRKVTAEVLRKLEEAFSWGCTDAEACVYANLAPRTFYDYCEQNEEFSQWKEVLKDSPTMKAKSIIKKSLDDGDIGTANQVINRKEGTKVRQELTGKDGGAIKTESTTTINFIPVGPDDA